MIRAVIFDFFGVIRTDSYKTWIKKRGYEDGGKLLEASERHDRGEYSEQAFFQALAMASDETVDQVMYELETGNELNEELINYIATLHDHYKVALLSNASSTYLRGELKKYDLEDYFDEIVVSSEVALIKPDPRIFEYLLEKLHVQPNECIFIDDTLRNVTAAIDIDIHGIAFSDVPTLKNEIEKLIATT